MFGELIPVGGGDPIPLLQPKLIVGRRSRCDIVLDFPNISSRHCELELIDGYWQVRDLNSSNGIKVNGERCDKKWLYPGDDLSVAKNHFTITYDAVGEAPQDDSDIFSMSLLEKAGLEAKRSENRHRKLPPAVKRPAETRFDANEEEAARWLMDE